VCVCVCVCVCPVMWRVVQPLYRNLTCGRPLLTQTSNLLIDPFYEFCFITELFPYNKSSLRSASFSYHFCELSFYLCLECTSWPFSCIYNHNVEYISLHSCQPPSSSRPRWPNQHHNIWPANYKVPYYAVFSDVLWLDSALGQNVMSSVSISHSQ
jgi:hypothetical protein